MQLRRIFLSLGLIVLALLLAASGAFLYPSAQEIIVPIDRSVLAQKKLNVAGPIRQSEMPEASSPRSVALKPVPDPRLVEKTELGLLPRKAENGDRASDIYSRPYDFTQSTKDLPKLSLVLIRSGISEIRTVESYVALPPEVSFSLSPYAQDAQRQIRDIRNRGHEVFLDVLSKTDAATQEDRGPQALDPEKDTMFNRQRLYWMMSRFSGYAGLVGDWTPTAIQSGVMRQLVESEAKTRGLGLISIVRPHRNAIMLVADSTPEGSRKPLMTILPGRSPSELIAALNALTAQLKPKGRAVAFIDPGPRALDTLKDWISKFQSYEFDLVPLRSLMRLEEQG
jgi:hypothetical protein